jgi:hypothetical protein
MTHQTMKRTPLLLAIVSLAAATGSQAAVVARFDTFTHVADNPTLASDVSAQAGWTTSDLTDLATGIGALSASNQGGANRKINSFGTTPTIQFSSNREGDGQTPLAAGGNNESTWITFTVSATGANTLDFTGQVATAETFAEGTGLGGSVSADWTLYFSLDGGSSWSALGTETGASIGGSGGESSATAVGWALSGIGASQTTVDFILDATSTGSTNGNVSQRGVAVGNFEVNAVIVPEPAVSLLGAFGLLALLRRRR